MSGYIYVYDTTSFVSRQQVTLSNPLLGDLTLFVYALVNSTTLQVINASGQFLNLATYTNVSGSTLSAPYQLNPVRNGVGTTKFLTDGGGITDLNVDGSGTAKVYTVVPDAGTRYSITGIGLGFVAGSELSVYTGAGNKNPTMPQVKWNALVGLNKLTNGILSATQINNAFTYTALFQDHMDLMLYPNVRFQYGFFDSSSTWLKYDVSFGETWGGTPLILDSRTGDYISFTVQDNLSSLAYFRILTNGIVDQILPAPYVT